MSQCQLLRRNVERSLADEIKTFVKEIERKTGAQLFIMAGFERPSGTVAITRYLMLHVVAIVF